LQFKVSAKIYDTRRLYAKGTKYPETNTLPKQPLVDYGKGIRQSLLSVIPLIESDKEAIEIAFTKRISGRSPEQRGNGLKFVSETIQQNNWSLYFQSGSGACSIDKNGIQFLENTVMIPGCLAIMNFEKDL
jgi:hypothetical protein